MAGRSGARLCCVSFLWWVVESIFGDSTYLSVQIFCAFDRYIGLFKPAGGVELSFSLHSLHIVHILPNPIVTPLDVLIPLKHLQVHTRPIRQIRPDLRAVRIDHDIIFDQRCSVRNSIDLLVKTGTGIQDIAELRWLLRSSSRHITDTLRSLGAVVGITDNVNTASSDILIVQYPHEDLECCLGLVRRAFMTGFIESDERQIAVLSDLTADVRLIHTNRLVASAAELLGTSVVYGEGSCFATDPVAGKITITIEEVDLDVVLE